MARKQKSTAKEYRFDHCALRGVKLLPRDGAVKNTLTFRMAFDHATAKQIGGLATYRKVRGEDQLDPGIDGFKLGFQAGSCSLALVPEGLSQNVDLKLDRLYDFRVLRDKDDKVHCNFKGQFIGKASKVARYVDLAGAAPGMAIVVTEEDKQARIPEATDEQKELNV